MESPFIYLLIETSLTMFILLSLFNLFYTYFTTNSLGMNVSSRSESPPSPPNPSSSLSKIYHVPLDQKSIESMTNLEPDERVIKIDNKLLSYTTKKHYIIFESRPFTNEPNWKNAPRMLVTFGSCDNAKEILFDLRAGDIYNTPSAWKSLPFRKGNRDMMSLTPFVETLMDDELLLSLHQTPSSDLILRIRFIGQKRQDLYFITSLIK